MTSWRKQLYYCSIKRAFSFTNMFIVLQPKQIYTTMTWHCLKGPFCVLIRIEKVTLAEWIEQGTHWWIRRNSLNDHKASEWRLIQGWIMILWKEKALQDSQRWLQWECMHVQSADARSHTLRAISVTSFSVCTYCVTWEQNAFVHLQ